MTTIGRAFAFYIKYWGQMEYIRENGVETLAQAPRQHYWEEVKKQLEAVRVRADAQAARLIVQCGEMMKDHFLPQQGMVGPSSHAPPAMAASSPPAAFVPVTIRFVTPTLNSTLPGELSRMPLARRRD